MRKVAAVTPRGAILRCRVAERSRDRRMGLRGARDLPHDTALLFPNATSVHTLGTRFPILVVRIDDTFTVVDVRRILPRRFVPPMGRATGSRRVESGSTNPRNSSRDRIRKAIGSTSRNLKPDAELSRFECNAVAILPALPFGRGRGRARSDPGPHRLAA